MKTRDIKTIDVNCKEWFDRINGNSYFSCHIIINYGKANQKELFVPITYGYGDYYRYEAFDKIKKELNCFKAYDNKTSYWRVYEKENITIRHTKQENCPKRELNQTT